MTLGVLSGCGPVMPDDPVPQAPSTAPGSFGSAGPPLFNGKTERASSKVAPVAGGTLLVTSDRHAVAADPDRDAVHVVDLATQKVVSIPLQEGDEPGRVIEGPSGTAYVIARRGGAVVAVDIVAGTARRFPVCAAPRGVAYDAALSKLYVACRSGVLAVLDPASGGVSARYRLDPDLRDVLISGDNLVVTRFKTAELMVVSRDGQVLRRSSLQPAVPAAPGVATTPPAFTPSVAYRALSLPGGGVLVGHVDSSNTTLPSGAGAYYGAGCGGVSVADLSLTVMNPSSGSDRSGISLSGASRLSGASGPLDVALSPDGKRVAMLATGNSWDLTSSGAERENLWLTTSTQLATGGFTTPCFGASTPDTTASQVAGEPVAVAFDSDGHWVAQSRQPAQLQLEQGGVISLAADVRFDTGFAMFHTNTGGGIACTSCHPEAGEDGHTWSFSIGPRRSQTLEGGASGRAPFHWSGDLATFDSLIDEVMLKRMSLFATVDKDQRGALRDWLDSVPKAATADDLDAEAVARGRALFNDSELACATCHSGPDYTDNAAHDVGTGAAFVTPSLIDVNIRAPLFHDGCAKSLDERFGLCGGGDAHGHTSQLSKSQQRDLVAFMQSL